MTCTITRRRLPWRSRSPRRRSKSTFHRANACKGRRSASSHAPAPPAIGPVTRCRRASLQVAESWLVADDRSCLPVRHLVGGRVGGAASVPAGARTSATAAAESLGLVLLRAPPRTGCRRSTTGFSGVSSSPGPRPPCWCSSGAFAVSRQWRTRETPPRAPAERCEPHAGQGCDAGTGRADPPSLRRDLVSAEGASFDRSPAGRLDLCAVRRDERGIPVLRLLELWLGVVRASRSRSLCPRVWCGW